jgi:hypothetical protein
MTYSIAIIGDSVLALAPDGDKAEYDKRLASAKEDIGDDTTLDAIIEETGVTLLDDDDGCDYSKGRDRLLYSACGGRCEGQLTDENGKSWRYAVKLRA